MMLVVWKSSSKPLNKIKYKINIFWQFFYTNICLKYWLTNYDYEFTIPLKLLKVVMINSCISSCYDYEDPLEKSKLFVGREKPFNFINGGGIYIFKIRYFAKSRLLHITTWRLTRMVNTRSRS